MTPDIAGQGKANPTAMILSTAMMLDWLADKQVLDVYGDWADNRPGVRPGGWEGRSRSNPMPLGSSSVSRCWQRSR